MLKYRWKPIHSVSDEFRVRLFRNFSAPLQNTFLVTCTNGMFFSNSLLVTGSVMSSYEVMNCFVIQFDLKCPTNLRLAGLLTFKNSIFVHKNSDFAGLF